MFTKRLLYLLVIVPVFLGAIGFGGFGKSLRRHKDPLVLYAPLSYNVGGFTICTPDQEVILLNIGMKGQPEEKYQLIYESKHVEQIQSEGCKKHEQMKDASETFRVGIEAQASCAVIAEEVRLKVLGYSELRARLPKELLSRYGPNLSLHDVEVIVEKYC